MAVVVIVSRALASGSGRRVGPGSRVQDLLLAVGVDTAAVGILQEQGYAGNPVETGICIEGVVVEIGPGRCDRDQGPAGVAQDSAPGPAAGKLADELIRRYSGGPVSERRNGNEGRRSGSEPPVGAAIERIVDAGATIGSQAQLLLVSEVRGEVQAMGIAFGELDLKGVIPTVADRVEPLRQCVVVFGEGPETLCHAGAAG